ncbi:PspC domain-containing protein [[Clostridium] colinum]|uniref:PspC domain-containing protein n=1 Tax=[Clostridium] colinum TaxID=36835 RepID=UPI002023C4B2|nr:PspC domain-containing protein [[Clostridium] colinum]
MEKRLILSKSDKMIAGVCGGIGEYFKIDPTIIRIFFVLLSFIFLGSTIPLYIIFWIIIPSQNIKIPTKKYKEGFYDFSEFDDK